MEPRKNYIKKYECFRNKRSQPVRLVCEASPADTKLASHIRQGIEQGPVHPAGYVHSHSRLNNILFIIPTFRDEDPVLAKKNLIRGSIPQTKGDL